MGMTVSGAAEAAGVSAKAVRLWEARGLVAPAPRTDAGYRQYNEDDLGVLRFIGQAKTLGLTLPEIKEILDLQRQGATPCARVTELLDSHLAEIDRALRELRALRRSLAAVRRAARDTQRRGGDVMVCTLIEAPAGPATPPS